MRYEDLKKCHMLNKVIIFKAMNIFYQIKDRNITIDKYDYCFDIKDDNITRPLKEENAKLKQQDKIVLSLYLSYLTINTNIKTKLNMIGIEYRDVLFHLDINIKEKFKLTEEKYKDMYNNYFAKTLNLIWTSDEKDYRITYKDKDKDFYKLIYDSIYDRYIVESEIVENLLLDMDFYDDYIESYTIKEDELNNTSKLLTLLSKENITNPKVDNTTMFNQILHNEFNVPSKKNTLSSNNKTEKVKVIDINSRRKK